MAQKAQYGLLRRYLLKEFVLALAVSLLFFFFIFFVNQLLLFAQRILLKNVNVESVLLLVLFSLPQILLYTIPFSTLTASAMVIGDLSERREMLALRSLGIPLRKVFEPLCICAVVLGMFTFFVADTLLPYSNLHFKELYADLMQEIPTLELNSYSVNHIGDIILAVGEVEKGKLSSLILLDNSDRENQRLVSSSEGTIELVDINSLLYRLELKDPLLLSTAASDLEDYSLAKAQNLTYYLDFSSQVTRFTDITPSQLSSRDLLQEIALRQADLQIQIDQKEKTLAALQAQAAFLMRQLTLHGGQGADVRVLTQLHDDIDEIRKHKPINFYIQYYKAELHKKIALAFSCLMLMFLTFPLSLVQLKHGKLFGFALSLVIASAYWFLLFFMQTNILDPRFNPGLLIWVPNLVALGISLIFLIRSVRL
ncbi:MAG: LptF/LptG family permease [Sphaerochaetaceae bacterium]